MLPTNSSWNVIAWKRNVPLNQPRFFNEKTSVNWIGQFNSEVLNKKNNPIQLNNNSCIADENGFYFRATLE